MITERDHPAFIQPNEEDIIWRYINLEKFESLLIKKSLFFCRADKFSDPFEGSIPRKESEFRIQDQKRISNFYGTKFNSADAEKNIEGLSSFHKKFRKTATVNCWHINNFESDGMWQLYLKSNEGVAIKTTVAKLIKSFENTFEDVFVSKVRYIDYDNDIWYNEKEYPCQFYNFLTPIIHKRKEFMHERELRLLCEVKDAIRDDDYWLNQENEKGIFLSVNIETLIEQIILHPTSDKFVEAKVFKLLEKYKLNKEVKNSKLSTEPIY